MFRGLVGMSTILAIVFMLFAQTAVTAQEIKEADAAALGGIASLGSGSRRIEGLWNVQVTARVCATGAPIVSFPAMGLFARGGAMHDTNATNPAIRSSGFGTWNHVRGNRYRFAFKFFDFDAAGNSTGYRIVRHNVILGSDGEEYESAGTAEFYDANGNLIRTGCSSSTATRFN